MRRISARYGITRLVVNTFIYMFTVENTLQGSGRLTQKHYPTKVSKWVAGALILPFDLTWKNDVNVLT